jgi:hypothetical protein
MRTTRTLASLAAAAAVTAATALTPVSATTASCPRGWGSLAESSRAVSDATLANVRSGRHACYDRLVIDLDGRADGYRVAYGPVYAEGTGDRVPLRGAADLRIVVMSPAYDDEGDPTYVPRRPREVVNVAGYRTFRQVAWAGSFEGQTTLGLGVRARLPFRTFVLPGPGDGSRLVIDVAHRW